MLAQVYQRVSPWLDFLVLAGGLLPPGGHLAAHYLFSRAACCRQGAILRRITCSRGRPVAARSYLASRRRLRANANGPEMGPFVAGNRSHPRLERNELPACEPELLVARVPEPSAPLKERRLVGASGFEPLTPAV
jgi:hypothetical protein